MGFNKSFPHILLRVILLVGLAFALSYSFLETDLLVTPFMFGALILVGVIELTYYLGKQERSWIKFLQSVKYRDFSRAYHRQASPELSEAFELITESMEELKSSKQAEFRLLQTVLGHISIGVVCYRGTGEVVFTNKAFDNLLDLSGLTHIDRIQNKYPQIHEVIIKDKISSIEWIDHKGQKLFLKSESFELKRKKHKLISIADIKSSLDAKELESYHKLMRVMTHEIMNSTTPILSLIRVVNKKLINGEQLNTLAEKDQQKIATSLQAIEDRTSGMLKFVEAYKEINKSIVPHFESVRSSGLLTSIQALMDSDTGSTISINDQINDLVLLDKSLITQVIINLVKNALEATESLENGKIEIDLLKKDGNVIIAIQDNGNGVSDKDISQIFIPFYTTKESGSGIGLALSRKIVKAHRGELNYARVDKRTRFSIHLPEEVN